MPSLRELVDATVRRFPSYDIAPRARTRHQALVSAREARDQALRTPDSATTYYPFAARSPHRSYRLTSGVHISLEDRWVACGFKGCGKTTLARQLVSGLARLYPMASVYILDSKGDRLFDRYANLVESEAPPPALAPGASVVWRPPDDDIDAYSAWLNSILKTRRPAIVFIDELSSLGKNSANSFAPGYAKMLKQGRSLHQCVITLTQDAAYIPRQTFGQLDHLVRMRVLNEHDAKALDRFAHGTHDPRREPSHPHGLWYKALGRAEPAREFDDWRALLK
jgi:hypothetical protein